MKDKNNLAGIVVILMEIVCCVVFIYAGFQLYSIFKDYKAASDEYNSLAEEVLSEGISVYVSAHMDDNEGAEEKKFTYEVDLKGLKEKNPDTVGWIILPDTKISYPIVKSKDNTDYLKTTFEGKRASSGAIFMDMYCEADFSSQNTIIYGHNMKNGSMFRALNNMTDKDYFNKHKVFYIDSGNGFEAYEVISCYATVETDLSSWRISFADGADYGKWLADVSKRCSYNCMPYDENKNTLTLSTCRGKSGGTGRFIVHLQKQ